MGGHGGLNILPQKRWNVYNFDNREKVRKDEEAAAREEQIKREEARKRDAESRLELLRNVRGLAPLKRPVQSQSESESESDVVVTLTPPISPKDEEPKTTDGHINLFEGIKIFDPIVLPKKPAEEEEEDHRRKKMKKEAAATARASAKDAAARAGDPDEDKYRLGYGVAGKGVKRPWYLHKPHHRPEDDHNRQGTREDAKKHKTGTAKKSFKELREERLKREKVEKERERALFMKHTHTTPAFSLRR